MMYNYRSVVFRNEKIISDSVKSIDGSGLVYHGVESSRSGFLELLNRWNRNGLLGLPNGGPIYMYIAV